jgi:hypothetical protein
MMLEHALVLEHYVNSYEQGQDRDQSLSKVVHLECCGHERSSSNSGELLLSQTSDGSCLPRVASRRIAGSKGHTVVDSDTSDLGLMDRSRVVSTGSRSGKGIESVSWLAVPWKFDGSVGADGHGVPDVDCDHLGPTARDLIERIGDRDAFIKDHHFRANEDHVPSGNDQCCPEGSCDATCKGEISKTLVGVNQRTDCGEREENVTTSWSEDHGISHDQIISWRGF